MHSVKTETHTHTHEHTHTHTHFSLIVFKNLLSGKELTKSVPPNLQPIKELSRPKARIQLPDLWQEKPTAYPLYFVHSQLLYSGKNLWICVKNQMGNDPLQERKISKHMVQGFSRERNVFIEPMFLLGSNNHS